MAKVHCDHAACRCTGDEVRRDGYCSDACRERREADGKCQCGHPECR